MRPFAHEPSRERPNPETSCGLRRLRALHWLRMRSKFSGIHRQIWPRLLLILEQPEHSSLPKKLLNVARIALIECHERDFPARFRSVSVLHEHLISLFPAVPDVLCRSLRI